MENEHLAIPHSKAFRALFVGAAAIVLAVIVIAWRLARERAHSELCQNNLKQISMALHAYHERYGSFPPAYTSDAGGQPMHSWRVLLLPFLGHEDLYEKYRMDEPWDSQSNRRLFGQMPTVYACPGVRTTGVGITNYYAVVGPETAWPENHAVAVRHILDGVAMTIQLIESADAEFCWLQPRDLSSDQAGSDDRDLHPSLSSTHRSGVNVLFADGSVRSLAKGIDSGMLHALFSIHGGRPLEGVDWPEDKIAGEEEFPPVTLATEWAETDIVPHLQGQIQPGRNYIFCGTFQLAWNELQDKLVKAPLALSGSPPMADELNRQTFRRGDLSESSYVAMAGTQSSGIGGRIQSAMKTRFPSVTPRLTDPSMGDVLVAYAFLQKNLPFATKFDKLPKPLRFRSRDGAIPVVGFGIEQFGNHGYRDDRLKEQVTILDYTSDDDFLLRLETKTDEIILAKLAPHASLADTIAAVLQRIREPVGERVEPKLRKNESLAVPKFRFNVNREYTELIGKKFQNGGWTNFHIGGATQEIRFLLNEAGARLESEAVIAVKNGHSEPPPKPRHFIFDRPFLICLREQHGTQPYFAVWVENSEVLTKRE
jgi:prepilin-type processing-associated H-X9-DG protein